MIGLGVGNLAAAAIALSPTVTSLIDLAIDIVIIAFRIGLQVDNIANHIDLQYGSSGWSLAINGIANSEVQSLLGSFHQAHVIHIPPKSKVET